MFGVFALSIGVSLVNLWDRKGSPLPFFYPKGSPFIVTFVP